MNFDLALIKLTRAKQPPIEMNLLHKFMDKSLAPQAERFHLASSVKLNVYDNGQPLCHCHTEADALMIVQALNFWLAKNQK